MQSSTQEKLPAIGCPKAVSSSIGLRGFGYTLPAGHAELERPRSDKNATLKAWDFHTMASDECKSRRQELNAFWSKVPSAKSLNVHDYNPPKMVRPKWGPPHTHGGHHTNNWWHGADIDGGWVGLTAVMKKRGIHQLSKPSTKRLPTLC